jgi:rhomboid protease GluP
MWGLASLLRVLGRDMGFVPIVLYACGALYVCTLVVDSGNIGMGGMSILAPSQRALFLFGESGAIPVFGAGRWWTVLSAAWLHGGILHIAFNMMWVRSLGPATIQLYGGARTIIIYTLSAVSGFVASSVVGAFMPFLPGFLRGAGFTVGASAPVFGLLGALIYFGRRGGSSLVGDQAKRFAGLLFVFGFILPGVDNWAHLGGLAGGYAAARWLDPLRPERVEHVLAALACLGLSLLSIVVSVVHGLKFVR